MTSRLLLEAGYSWFYVPRRHDGQRPAGRDLRSDLGDGAVHRDQSGDGLAVCTAGELRLSRAVADHTPTTRNPNSWRASASYVTGSHNMKVGYQGGY